MNILNIADWIDPTIYSEKMKYRMKDIDLIISCGDISVSYMDFIMSELNKPLIFVVGNHVSTSSYTKTIGGKAKVTIPDCFKNVHMKIININGLLISGFEGSIWYNGGPFQYKQWEVFVKLIKLIPRLLYNKFVHGRYIDIFVAHSPPFGVGDRQDPCHTGLKAFNWFIKRFKPQIFVHGHVHLYDRNSEKEINYNGTRVINCSGFYKLSIDPITKTTGEKNVR